MTPDATDDRGAKTMNGNALGLIETLGLVGLITAVDAMLKAASVELASSVHQARRRRRERDDPRRRQQRPGGGRGRRRGRRPGRRAPGRPRHSPAGHCDRPGVRREARPSEDPRRQPGQHQLQVPPLRHERPGRAAAGARGDRADRLASAKVVIKSARGEREQVWPIADHGEAVQLCLDQLTDPEIGVLERRGRGRGDRLQGGPCRGT